MPIVPGVLLRQRYDVLTELGQGGHAIVYRGHDRDMGRDVAIKVLREEILSPDLRARFTQEIQVMARLEHPHILRVHDSGAENGQPYVVMELAPSKTLADRLVVEPQLPISEALQITREVGSALAHAHAKGILHRDVKPDNILLGAGGALLADFGIARVTGEMAISRITNTGEAVGTLQYMSPEQLCAEPVDARSDQYALACVLYEMIAGVRPHTAATFEGLRVLRLTGRHAPVSVYRNSAPPLLEDIVQRAMAVAPADRFRSMDELLQSLDVLLTGESAGGTGSLGGTGARPGTTVSAASGSAMPVAGTVFPAGMRRRPWAVGIALVASAAATVAVLKPDVDAAANAAFDAASLLPSPTKDSLSQALVVRLGAELSAWTSPQPADQPSESRRRILRVTVIGDSAIVRITGVPELTYRTARATIDSAGVLPSRIVRELLAGGDDAAFPGLHELPIRSGVVLRRFTDGHRLLERGQLDSARAAFAVAADSAPQFAAAHFWSAQAAAWGATPFDERTRRHIADAVRIGRKSRYDSLLVVALAHLAGQRYTEACAAYGEAKHIDARSYVAALGQGECQRQNPVVLMRRGAVAFQTSHWAALQAYREGLESAPSSRLAFALLPKLSRLTYSAGSEMRAGRTVDGRSYFALPSRSADSLAFFPVDSQVFVTGGPGAVPASWSDALRLGRMTAAAIASSMTTRFPEDPLLWLERAIALERAGSIDPAIRPSAYSAAQEAERLGARESAALDLTLLRIRLAIRRGLLDSAVVMARSLLSGRDTTTMTPSRREARMRAMATLVKDRGTLSRAPAPGEDTLPASVRAPYRTFVNAVLLDDCREARSAAGLLERSVAAALPAAARDAADRFLLSTSRAGTTCLGAIALAKLSPAGTPLDRALLELAKGNKANALRAMATTSALRSGATASALTWNYLSLEAWMRREAGDTSGSVSLILDALEDLPSMSAYTMEDAEQVAGLRRALRILHEIDRARPGSAGRWRDVAKD